MVIGGGNNNSGDNTNTMEYITISTTGDVTDLVILQEAVLVLDIMLVVFPMQVEECLRLGIMVLIWNISTYKRQVTVQTLES